MALSSTSSKPPPSGNISVTLNFELLKKTRLLNKKLAGQISALSPADKLLNDSLIHIALTEAEEQGLTDTSLLKQELPLEETKRLFSFLCAQVKNKALKSKEILAIEEYKVAILEGCRTTICDSALTAFKLHKETYTVVAPLRTYLPDLKLIPEINKRKEFRDTSLDELQTEFDLVQREKTAREKKNRFINKIKMVFAKLGWVDPPPPDETPLDENNYTRKRINIALNAYKEKILANQLFKRSGLSQNHRNGENKKSSWKKMIYRIGFTFSLLLMTLVYGSVEFAGAQSLLMLIPEMSNPIAFGVSIVLMAISSVIEIALGLKMFKETYGFSYFGRSIKTYLRSSENELALTNDINEMLHNNHAMKKLDSNTYQNFCTITHSANKDIRRKITNINSPFSLHKDESWWRFAIRLTLNGVNALTALAGAYFLSWDYSILFIE